MSAGRAARNNWKRGLKRGYNWTAAAGLGRVVLPGGVL